MEFPAVRRSRSAVFFALGWGILGSFLVAVVLNEIISAPRWVMVCALITGIVGSAVRGLLVAVEARPDGLWVRNVFRTVLVGWDEIESVKRTMVGRGALTLAITRRGDMNPFLARVSIVALGGSSLDRARELIDDIEATYPADPEVARVVALIREGQASIAAR